MITVRPSRERGHFNFGWLDTYHTFSFGDYQDPAHHHFRYLRVINQDIVKPHQGFATHSHDNMEIITYMLRGEITHEDSMHNKKTIRAGEIQYMSAGTGVTHSERNETNEELELLQIWILPATKNLTPAYAQQKLSLIPNQLNLVISSEARDSVIAIHQDIKLFIGQFNQPKAITYALTKNRHAWLQLITGDIEIEGKTLHSGDGAAISDQETLLLDIKENTHFLLFDLN